MHMRFTEQPFTVGRVLAGRFRIVRPLGFGGMGTVFEVEHELTRHRRALKLLHPQMAEMPGVVERFLREASAAGRIGNAHIVETFDAGRLDTGEPYIVMELLQGRSLAEVLHEGGPLELSRACELLVQACDGIGAAHAAGIVHRDLKPENLFLADPNESFVKILDFGISKFDAALTGVEGLTLEGSPMGTPYYMSPEQLRGQKTVDARTDVYALGVVLYECLTARRPFEAESLPELIFRIVEGQWLAPSELRPGLPTATDEILRKAMALDPAERFASAKELARAVAGVQSCPERTLLLSDAPVQGSSFPAVASTELVPALTPGVFSSTSAMVATAKRRKRVSRPGVILGVSLVALVTIGVVFWASMRSRTGTTPSGAALPLATAEAPFDPSSTSDTSKQVLAEVPTAPAEAADAPVKQVPGAIGAEPQPSWRNPPAQRPANASPSRATGIPSRAAPSNAAATSRAASQGLAEDNPFK